MTTVYGVTMYGARQQIQGQLEAIEEFPRQYLVQAREYLASKIFEKLHLMFTSSKSIQVCKTNTIISGGGGSSSFD